MSTYQNPPTSYEPPPTNGLGVAGFAISLTGLVACGGFLSPIGLVLSLVALAKEPRGFAIAGSIIGLLGTALAITVILAFAGAIGSFSSGGWFGWSPTLDSIYTATYEIDSHYAENSDTLPDDDEGSDMVASYLDEWGKPIRYRATPGSGSNAYELYSAGPDGMFDTGDDIIQPFTAYSMSTSPWGMPETPETTNEVSQQAVEDAFAFAAQIINESVAPGDPLPSQQRGTQLLVGVVDVWGEPIRYRTSPDDPLRFRLQSGGPNQVWDGGGENTDDITSTRDFVPQGNP